MLGSQAVAAPTRGFSGVFGTRRPRAAYLPGHPAAPATADVFLLPPARCLRSACSAVPAAVLKFLLRPRDSRCGPSSPPSPAAILAREGDGAGLAAQRPLLERRSPAWPAASSAPGGCGRNCTQGELCAQVGLGRGGAGFVHLGAHTQHTHTPHTRVNYCCQPSARALG